MVEFVQSSQLEEIEFAQPEEEKLEEGLLNNDKEGSCFLCPVWVRKGVLGSRLNKEGSHQEFFFFFFSNYKVALEQIA